MILSLISTALILGYGYFMWRRGLFEALVMAVCCVFAAGVAVTCYQYIASLAGLDKSQPSFGEPLAMGLLFLVSLFVMRFLADRFIKSEMHLPLYVDKAIAAILGVFSGIIMIGIPLTMLQMIPLGGRSIMDYKPFDDNLENYAKFSPFAPDDFVLGIGKVFSAASMGNGHAMPSAQEQKLNWFIRRNSAGLGGTTLASQENLASVQEIYEIKSIRIDPVRLSRSAEYKNYALRCVMDINATDDDRWWRLPATQFALFCRDNKGRMQRHFPIGYIIRRSSQTAPGWSFDMLPSPNDAVRQPLCLLAIERSEKEVDPDEKGLVVDWVYQIPDDEQIAELVFRNCKPFNLSCSMIKQGLPLNFRDLKKARITLAPKNEKEFMPVISNSSAKPANDKFEQKVQKLPSVLIKQTTKDKLIKINEHEKALDAAVENQMNQKSAK
ncbi:MAG TPA: CvpA family protein [Phycisphaerae bacterium]|nr:CvpA family protein [Phycisphaerae bacterium]HPS52531.1 CvpA family protein [Phycisphaerae bacterium]